MSVTTANETRSSAKPVPAVKTDARLHCMSGFGNEFTTEALPGALPDRGNSPQKAPYGLYAEQINGTAFTVARSANRRSWLYRIRPAAGHGTFEPSQAGKRWLSSFNQVPTPASRIRWDPMAIAANDAGKVTGSTSGIGLGVATASAPGYVKTPLVEGQIADQAKVHNMSTEQVVREVILASQPNKRFVEVAELGALVVFLASPAGASITGIGLPVDGGWTAR